LSRTGGLGLAEGFKPGEASSAKKFPCPRKYFFEALFTVTGRDGGPECSGAKPAPALGLRFLNRLASSGLEQMQSQDFDFLFGIACRRCRLLMLCLSSKGNQ
jgi:hypothetical protein